MKIKEIIGKIILLIGYTGLAMWMVVACATI